MCYYYNTLLNILSENHDNKERSIIGGKIEKYSPCIWDMYLRNCDFDESIVTLKNVFNKTYSGTSI